MPSNIARGFTVIEAPLGFYELTYLYGKLIPT